MIVEYGTTGSKFIGQLPKGCKDCLIGKKSVLYITGKCRVGCYYCTISHDKRSIDSIHINETQIDLLATKEENFDVLDREINLCTSTGVGLTGGDPLETPDRTIDYITHLKATYGRQFHVHLYTSGQYFKADTLEKLTNAGLDELRVHPKEIKDIKIWNKVCEIKDKYPNLLIGFEVPAIPMHSNEIEELIEFAIKNEIKFINFNEFEFTETNFSNLNKSGYIALTDNSSVIGSKSMMDQIFEKYKDQTTTALHFCSSGSKDAIQLTQRYQKRANSIARPFESISDEGELEFGILRVKTNEELEELKHILTDYLDLPSDLYVINNKSKLIETTWIVVDEFTADIRELLPHLEAEIISRHPIENGPITWVDRR